MDTKKPELTSRSNADNKAPESHQADSESQAPTVDGNNGPERIRILTGGENHFSVLPGLEFLIRDMSEQAMCFQRILGALEVELKKTENKECFSIGPMNGHSFVLQGLTDRQVIRDILMHRMGIVELSQPKKPNASANVSSSKSSKGDLQRSKTEKADR